MLSTKQYRKLKFIQRMHGTTATDRDKYADMYNFFLAKGLVKRKEIEGFVGLVITQDGETELYMHKLQSYHFWMPTFLSFIAIITSIAAVFTQNEELYGLLKELLQSLI